MGKEKNTEREMLRALYLDRELSIRDIAGLLGMKKDKIHRLLRKNNIKREKKKRKPKRKDITLEYLEREFKRKPKTEVARELGLSRGSIYNYIKRLKSG